MGATLWLFRWLVLAMAVSSAAAQQAGANSGAGQIARGVTKPEMQAKVEPKYSELARRLRVEGDVTLQVVITPEGRARDFRGMRSMGFGLDELAIESVSQWQFKPGTKDGQAVSVSATIQVNFRLLQTNALTWYTGPVNFHVDQGTVPPSVTAGSPPTEQATSSNQTVVLEFTITAT